MKDWEILLRLKEKELRSSPVISDKVYLYRYVDGYRIGKIACLINYSKSQVYRILKQIDKKCDKMRK